MLFHTSIAAEDPSRVAAVIAELWVGKSFRCREYPGACVAIAPDDRNTVIEVMPLDFEFVPGRGADGAQGHINAAPSRFSASHLAIATPRTEAQVHAIAAREGWIAKTCNRNGLFDVIEFWVEDGFMLEVMTPEMQAAYLSYRAIDVFEEIAFDELAIAA